MDKIKQYMKQKYKVTLFTKWFDVPTSLSCENIITYTYIVAANVSEVEERIKRFKGRKEIIKIEEYKKGGKLNDIYQSLGIL